MPVSESASIRSVRIEDLGRHVGEEVELHGWVHHRRGSGKVQFLVLRDGSGQVQAVGVKGELPDDAFDGLDTLPQESAVIVRGIPRADTRAPGRLRAGAARPAGRPRRPAVPDHAQGARRPSS